MKSGLQTEKSKANGEGMKSGLQAEKSKNSPVMEARKVIFGCFRILWNWCRSSDLPCYPELNTVEMNPADLNQADPVAVGLDPWETVGDKANRRFSDSCKPAQSLWIERKIFSVVPLIPGSSIRIIEILVDRRFTVDFKTIEVPWLIGALREASKAKSGAAFSKRTTIGRRSMVCSTVFNRAGVYIKLICSYGGDNRRILHIPAGLNGEGWSRLANFLANTSSGAKFGTKKHKAPISIHRSKEVVSQRRVPPVSSNRSFAAADKGKKRWKEKSTVDDGWKEGLLPDPLKMTLANTADGSSAPWEMAGGKGKRRLSIPSNKLKLLDSSVRTNRSYAEAVIGKKRMKAKAVIDDGWKEGFLIDLLKAGLNSKWGDPSSSHEAERLFVWKAMESEFGLGLLVVERELNGGWPVKSTIKGSQRGGLLDGVTGGDGLMQKRNCAEDGGAVEITPVGDGVSFGCSISGNALSANQKAFPLPVILSSKNGSSRCMNDDLLSGGYHSTCAFQTKDSPSREGLSLEEQVGKCLYWAEDLQPKVVGLVKGQEVHHPTEVLSVNEACDSGEGLKPTEFGPDIGNDNAKKVEGPSSSSALDLDVADLESGSPLLGFGSGVDGPMKVAEQIIGLPCRPRRGLISVGPRKETGPVLDCSSIAAGSGSIPGNWSSISEEVSKLSPYVRRVVSAGFLSGDDAPLFLARYEDITIADNVEDYSLDSFFNECNGGSDGLGEEIGGVTVLEECLSAKDQDSLSATSACDSPASYCSGVVVEEKSSEEGYSCPEESCLGSVHFQRSFKIAEMLRQGGFFQNMDRAVLQALIIKELLQDA